MDSTTFQIQSLFYQGAYEACVAEASREASSPLSDPIVRSRVLYAARSHIARHAPADALQLLPSSNSDLADVTAVRALAKYVQGQGQSALQELRDLAESTEGEQAQTVRVAAATALQLEGETEEALQVLKVGQASQELECIALVVHILLSINRLDLAQKEYNAARTWADDSLLIQLIEAWIGLKSGGTAAQQAYYVYDELSQNPSTGHSASVLNGKAAAQAALAHYEEARGAFDEALTVDEKAANALANKAALASYGAKATEATAAAQDALERLRRIKPQHPLLSDLAEKERAFDEAASHFALSGEA